MKAMKVMKTAMKNKAMKVSKIARGKRARAAVFLGTKEKTVTGLQKSDLIKNKRGKIVSKKASAAGKKRYAGIARWVKATVQAKKALGITGFAAIGGKTPQGKAIHAKAKAIYAEMKK